MMQHKLSIELSEGEEDQIDDSEYSAEELVHRSLRLYDVMLNPDEMLAEAQLNGGGENDR